MAADSFSVINVLHRSLIWKPPPHFGKSSISACLARSMAFPLTFDLAR